MKLGVSYHTKKVKWFWCNNFTNATHELVQ
jgi:hypothetical protein